MISASSHPLPQTQLQLLVQSSGRTSLDVSRADSGSEVMTDLVEGRLAGRWLELGGLITGFCQTSRKKAVSEHLTLLLRPFELEMA